ncbi:hypothetical protein IO46_05355 [Gallibacterium anatis]|nr:hypothetical protein IO46_05355 [Gallibacterium anatis]
MEKEMIKEINSFNTDLNETNSSEVSNDLDQHLKFIPSNLREKVKEKLERTIFYTPRIGIMGQSGAGKSSLANAIVGRKVFETGSNGGCTRKLQEEIVYIGKRKLIFVDLPGIAEDTHFDEEYKELYRKAFTDLDIILWVIKIDNRANQADKEFYKEIKQEFIRKYNREILFVLSQADKADPSDGWEHDKYVPSEEQNETILENKKRISEMFETFSGNVLPVACKYREGKFKSYGLSKLVLRIIEVLPKEAKASFYASANEEAKTESAKVEAQKGLWDTIVDTVKERIPEIVETLLPLAKIAIDKIFKKWF